MLQEEFLSDLRNFTITLKERMTRKRPTDLVPFAVCYRGNKRVARITLGNLVEKNLEILAVAVNMFDADQLGYVSEALQTGDAFHINPMTGVEWERGELTEAVAKHDALGKGWAVECIIVTAINRADDLASLTLPFRYVGGKHLSWQDDNSWDTTKLTTQGNDAQVMGLVPELLHEMMAKASAGAILDRLPANVPADQLDRDTFTAELLSCQPNVLVELFQ